MQDATSSDRSPSFCPSPARAARVMLLVSADERRAPSTISNRAEHPIELPDPQKSFSMNAPATPSRYDTGLFPIPALLFHKRRGEQRHPSNWQRCLPSPKRVLDRFPQNVVVQTKQPPPKGGGLEIGPLCHKAGNSGRSQSGERFLWTCPASFCNVNMRACTAQAKHHARNHRWWPDFLRP